MTKGVTRMRIVRREHYMIDKIVILLTLPTHRQYLYRDLDTLSYGADGCPVNRSDSGSAIFPSVLAACHIFDFAAAHEDDPNGPYLEHAAHIAGSF